MKWFISLNSLDFYCSFLLAVFDFSMYFQLKTVSESSELECLELNAFWCCLSFDDVERCQLCWLELGAHSGMVNAGQRRG